MKSLLSNRFGIPGVISVIALVFAMVGGAYAATNGTPFAGSSKQVRHNKKKQAGLNSKQKQEVKKIAQQFPGPAGPVGPAGSKGGNGSNGSNGSNGQPGSPGVSVTSEEFAGDEEPASEPCSEQGGTEFVSANATTYACNGQTGFTATLPTGKTEKGTWVAMPPGAEVVPGVVLTLAPISFNIPLATSLDASHVHYSTEAGFATNCPGSDTNPTAASGNLCVYATASQNLTFIEISSRFSSSQGANTNGALINFLVEATEPNYATGSWAVTG